MFLPYKISTNSIARLTERHLLNREFLDDQRSVSDLISESADLEQIKKSLIDGSRLQESWFPVDHPKMKFDVFISHSHKDVDKYVQPLASWLYSHLGLRCFIDSEFWLYADNLLKEFDDWYAYDSSTNTYLYNIRNYTTSHVHNMLSMALLKMMAKTECVLFVDSENSITYRKGQKETPSPWIYEEISFANNIEIRLPQRYIPRLVPICESGGVIQQRTFCSRETNPELRVQYKVNTDDFYEITDNTLLSDFNHGNSGNSALDFLHEKALAKYAINKRRTLFERNGR